MRLFTAQPQNRFYPLNDVTSSGENPLNLKILTVAQKAFPEAIGQFRQCALSSHLPDDGVPQVQLGYLTLIQTTSERKPFSEKHEMVLRDFFVKRWWTATCLHWKVAIPSFFTPALFPAVSYLALSDLDPTIQYTLNFATAALGVVIASYAGWQITGTLPDASSTAADSAQDCLKTLEDNYRALAIFLLDLYLEQGLKEDQAARKEFAKLIAENLKTDKLLEAGLAAFSADNKTQTDFKSVKEKLSSIIDPLKQCLDYINTLGANSPRDIHLRQIIERHVQSQEFRAEILKLTLAFQEQQQQLNTLLKGPADPKPTNS